MEKHILIVEDEPEFLYGLDLFLKKSGFITTRAADGAEALCRIIRKVGKNFDLVLLDLQLPRIDGFGVLAELAAQNITVPVVVVSGTLDIHCYIDLIHLGCRDIILKPVNPETLLRRIDEIINHESESTAKNAAAGGGLELSPDTDDSTFDRH